MSKRKYRFGNEFTGWQYVICEDYECPWQITETHTHLCCVV